MTFFRNRMFLQGIALGSLFGIIIGSIIAFTIGESSVEAIRRVIRNRFPAVGKRLLSIFLNNESSIFYNRRRDFEGMGVIKAIPINSRARTILIQ